MRGDARHALHAHVCRVGTRTGTAEQRIKAARHTVQGGVHGWESMGRLLRPGTCAKITHIELRIEHRAPRLLPARCDDDAWPCLDFQALGRRRGDDDLQPDSARLHRSDALLGALQERTGPRRHLVGREARTRKPARFLIGGFSRFPSDGAGATHVHPTAELADSCGEGMKGPWGVARVPSSPGLRGSAAQGWRRESLCLSLLSLPAKAAPTLASRDGAGPFLSDARVGGRRARAPDGPGKAAPSAWCVVLRRAPCPLAAARGWAGPCARHMFRPSPCFGTPSPHFLLARPPTSADAAAGRDGARGRGVRAGRRISGARRCAALFDCGLPVPFRIELPSPVADRPHLAR